MDARLEVPSGLLPQANLVAQAKTVLGIHPSSLYQVECFDAGGHLKWVEEFNNIVVTTGLNKLLDATIKTGLASPTWFVALIGSGGSLGDIWPTDTMISHSGWIELGTSVYSGTRPAFTPGTIASGSVDNSASKAVFNITGASQTVYGCFLTNDNTTSGTSGILYGAGYFTLSRDTLSGDVLNVQITLSIS